MGFDLGAILPAPEIEHLYTCLGRAYEVNDDCPLCLRTMF
jgi:hypothetical protein